MAASAKPVSRSISGGARRVRSARAGGHGGDRRPTIRAVAERACVAISTVSRVLNGGHASDVARDRVQLAVHELGYTPSVAAQSLVTRRSGCIGLAVNSTRSPWFSQILGGLEEALLPSRKSVLLASMTQNDRYDASAVAAWIRERRVDGLVLVRFARRNQPLFVAAKHARLPVVLIAPDVAAPADFTVRCDNVEAGRRVAEHLAGLRHQKIAFAGGPRDSIDTRQRLRGLNDGLSERGLRVTDDRVWFGVNYAPEAGMEFARQFLAEPRARRPTAVVLGNDAMALGFMRVLSQGRVRIPEEVSVVGFDGIPEGGLFWPGLTTVAQPTHVMASAACKALLDAVEGRGKARARSAEFAVELLVRESTAPAV